MTRAGIGIGNLVRNLNLGIGGPRAAVPRYNQACNAIVCDTEKLQLSLSSIYISLHGTPTNMTYLPLTGVSRHSKVRSKRPSRTESMWQSHSEAHGAEICRGVPRALHALVHGEANANSGFSLRFLGAIPRVCVSSPAHDESHPMPDFKVGEFVYGVLSFEAICCEKIYQHNHAYEVDHWLRFLIRCTRNSGQLQARYEQRSLTVHGLNQGPRLACLLNIKSNFRVSFSHRH